MRRRVPRLKTSEEAEAFLDQDLSDLYLRGLSRDGFALKKLRRWPKTPADRRRAKPIAWSNRRCWRKSRSFAHMTAFDASFARSFSVARRARRKRLPISVPGPGERIQIRPLPLEFE